MNWLRKLFGAFEPGEPMRHYGPRQPMCDGCPGRGNKYCCTYPYEMAQDGVPITPVMDDYAMKCCDCGLVHKLKFRAVKVTERFADGSFGYQELDPSEYRVELTAWRAERGAAISKATASAA